MTLSEAMRFYEKKWNLSISLEPFHPLFYRRSSPLSLAQDQYLHHSEFCRGIKLSGRLKECSSYKTAGFAKALKGKSFFSICPFGVREYCVPVFIGGRLGGILYFSFAPPGTGKKRDASSQETVCGIRRAETFLKELIAAEAELGSAEEGGNSDKKHRKESFYRESALNFIASHYPENIALSDLAGRLRVNPNYLGGILRRQTGKTFRELLTWKRLEESKVLLKFHRHLTVTQIAFLCGFSDGNYFSAVFHRKTGISPLHFRKSSDQLPEKETFPRTDIHPPTEKPNEENPSGKHPLSCSVPPLFFPKFPPG